MNTCRICKAQESGNSARRLFKYGARHYAHGGCGLKKFGADFLDKIPNHQLGMLPYQAIVDNGLLAEVTRMMKVPA